MWQVVQRSTRVSPKLRDDDLLDRAAAAAASAARSASVFGQRPGLVEVGRLVALPLVEELVVEDDAVDDQDDEAGDGEGQSHESASYQGVTNAQFGPRKKVPMMIEDDVHDHEGHEERVGQQPLPGEPLADPGRAPVEVGRQEQQQHHDGRGCRCRPRRPSS